MRICVFGGAFNPPHIGHIRAAEYISEKFGPDLFLIMPSSLILTSPDFPAAEERLALCREAFKHIPNLEISDYEINKSGRSYTSDTLRYILTLYPEAEISFVIGDDKLPSLKNWHEYDYLSNNSSFIVLTRNELDIPAETGLLPAGNGILSASSTDVRSLLKDGKGREYLTDGVYSLIVKTGAYSPKPSLDWLREKSYSYLKPSRVPHVEGCEKTAVELAELYGADKYKCAEAAILHDITKKLDYNEQLNLVKKYAIMCDDAELSNPALLHSKTGAYFAKEEFSIPQDVFDAIFWHTTGKPEMSMLEMIIYIADYIEPTRSFPAVEGLRELTYKNIYAGVAAALENTVEHVSSTGAGVHPNSIKALTYYKEYLQK